MALRRDEQFEESGWQQSAACRGDHASAFYPPPKFEPKEARLARERIAKSICARCSVVEPCLQFALRNGERHGIWGGRNETERDAPDDAGGR